MQGVGFSITRCTVHSRSMHSAMNPCLKHWRERLWVQYIHKARACYPCTLSTISQSNHEHSIHAIFLSDRNTPTCTATRNRIGSKMLGRAVLRVRVTFHSCSAVDDDPAVTNRYHELTCRREGTHGRPCTLVPKLIDCKNASLEIQVCSVHPKS